MHVHGEVQLSGSKVVEETVLNAVSIAAGAYVVFDYAPTTEDEIWVMVSIDKQPWTISGSSYVYTGTDGGSNFIYPARIGVTSAYGTLTPAISLLLGGVNVAAAWGLTPVTTIQEAKEYKITPYKSNLRGRILNSHATETATVTLKLLRVWKKGA